MNRFIQYIKHTLSHKISFWKFSELKKKIIEYGAPLLIIFICWEIVEDVGFPYLFYFYAKKKHKLNNITQKMFFIDIIARVIKVNKI